jgi:hypothetical protein
MRAAAVRATWVRHDQVEEHVFVFQYPFLPPVWSIEGKDLNGPGGEIRLDKSCRFPFFHPDGRERPAEREEQREVVIFFTRLRRTGWRACACATALKTARTISRCPSTPSRTESLGCPC